MQSKRTTRSGSFLASELKLTITPGSCRDRPGVARWESGQDLNVSQHNHFHLRRVSKQAQHFGTALRKDCLWFAWLSSFWVIVLLPLSPWWQVLLWSRQALPRGTHGANLFILSTSHLELSCICSCNKPRTVWRSISCVFLATKTTTTLNKDQALHKIPGS